MERDYTDSQQNESQNINEQSSSHSNPTEMPFVDRSPEALAMQQLQQGINNSQEVQQEMEWQNGVERSERSKQDKTSLATLSQADTPTKQEYKTFTDIKKMTLNTLHSYANKQADWHASPSLKPQERDAIRKILSFTREKHIRINCGNFLFNDVNARLSGASKDNDVFDPLRLYSKTAATSDPFSINQVSTTGDGMLVGQKLQLLISNFPSFILKTAMYKIPFDNMVQLSDVQKLVDYYNKAKDQPFFQSNSKQNKDNDFGAYNLLNSTKNPLDYDKTPLSGNIRNYHRFEQKALDQLVSNYGDTSKSKPLTVVLHSAIDHNGAFIRDSTMTDLITNGNLNILMIEGKKNLGDYEALVKPLAQKYGQNNKIDQVMFAGHGDAQSIQMGGDITEDKQAQITNPNNSTKMIDNPNYGKIKEIKDSIDLTKNNTAALALFNEVLDNMNLATDISKAPHRRVLFNACLTNSNNIPMTNGMNEVDARRAIQGWLSSNKNLVDTVLSEATAKGTDLTKVVGSVASHGSLKMFDSNDNLDLISSYDPKLTSVNKIDYVKAGKEPLGVLRAVYEIWSSNNVSDRTNLLTVIKARASKNSTDWRGIIIENAFKLISTTLNWKNADYIKGMQYMISTIDHCRTPGDCKVSNLTNLEYFINKTPVSNLDVSSILKALKVSTLWKNNKYVPTTFYQVWMMIDPSNSALTTELTTHINTQYTDIIELKQYLDTKYITKKGLSSKLLKTKGNMGEIKLALTLALNRDSDAINFLKRELVNNKFPTSHNIEILLGGAATELNILEILGVYTPPSSKTKTTSSTSSTASKANLSSLGDKQNSIHVDSVTMTGNTKKGLFRKKTTVYEKPDETSTKFKDLDKGSPVYILGSKDDWWAIEHTEKGKITTAFAKKKSIKV